MSQETTLVQANGPYRGDVVKLDTGERKVVIVVPRLLATPDGMLRPCYMSDHTVRFLRATQDGWVAIETAYIPRYGGAFIVDPGPEFWDDLTPEEDAIARAYAERMGSKPYLDVGVGEPATALGGE